MTTNMLTEEQAVTYGLKANGYGYGLGVRCPVDRTRVSDFGWGGAAAAFLVCDKEADATLYYAQHVLGSPNQDKRIQMAAILRDAFV